jgi:choline dehydrogenase
MGARAGRARAEMTGRNDFDVVVVGGGSAGCAVAGRLAETSSGSVLVLEAGPDLRADLPGRLRDGWRIAREFGWGLESEPDARGVVEGLHRGKLLGGTSWVTRFAIRGSASDYDQWVQLGNSGWGFDDVLPYFKRLESDLDFGGQPWHGHTGPIPISRYPDVEATQFGAAALRACAAAGFAAVEDHNRPGAVGAGRMPMNSRNGLRVTTADAYLPVGNTPANLTIHPGAQVAEVLVEGSEATGVRLLDGSVVDAGWVVLCAGTYGSPAILMRSGIGPAGHLKAVGIPVRANLPGVGANLCDHPGVDIDPGYHDNGRAAPLLHSLATFHSAAGDAGGAPDLALWMSDPSGDPATTSIDVVLLQPRSRGTVRLRSADPAQPPRIDLPGLREAADLDQLVEGFHRGWEVANQPELRRLCAEPPSPAPGSDNDLRRTIRREAYSDPHTVGTCAMGPSPDDGAVVDPSGRVHGVRRLSVIDASIIPTAPSGFPHIITIMIAERLAERLPTLL